MESKTATDLIKEAKQKILGLSPEQVNDEISSGKATLIDIRESDELKQNGKIIGSVHAPRGMLEFYADETLPYHKQEFDKNKRLILHCASGGRSALATATLQEMGFTNIAHLDGGIKAWKDSGMSTID